MTSRDLQLVWIIIIISGFGIYGAAVVPDPGVGNTWQRITLDPMNPRSWADTIQAAHSHIISHTFSALKIDP